MSDKKKPAVKSIPPPTPKIIATIKGLAPTGKADGGLVVWSPIEPPEGLRKSRWKGELNKPFQLNKVGRRIRRPNGFPVPGPDDPDAEQKIAQENEIMHRLIGQAISDEETRLLALLADHYKVASDDFRSLALALAREFVPAFRFDARDSVGRPQVWGPDRICELVDDVETVRKKENLKTDRDALIKLARTKKWHPSDSHRGSLAQWVETLETRLQEGRRFKRGAHELREMLLKIRDENSEKP